MKTLLTRSLSGAAFAAVMLTGICVHPYGCALLFFVICIGCLWEYYGITKSLFDTGKNKIDRQLIGMLNGMIVYIGFACVAFRWCMPYQLWLLLPVTMLMVSVELLSLSPVAIRNAALTAFGQLYIALPFGLLLWTINTTPFNHTVYDWYPRGCAPVLGLLLLIWAHDTFAYLGGTLLGRHKLYPEISPGKTWEGVAVGGVCCMLVGYGLFRWLGVYPLHAWLGLALIAAVMGTVGDLFESMIKRNVGVKDSGNLMPGHGGFLDRFDAFLFCIPFAYAWLLMAS